MKYVEPDEEFDFVFGANMVGPYDSAFRTFDAYDYSVIGIILNLFITPYWLSVYLFYYFSDCLSIHDL